MAMETDTNLTTLRIDSADELERKIAPAGYYPQQLSGPVVYDDEVEELPPDMPWREYFAGGSNRPHWIRTDLYGNPHFVECTGWGGSYEVYGPERRALRQRLRRLLARRNGNPIAALIDWLMPACVAVGSRSRWNLVPLAVLLGDSRWPRAGRLDLPGCFDQLCRGYRGLQDGFRNVQPIDA